MNRNRFFSLQLAAMFALLVFAAASCRTPNGPKPPAPNPDSCCNGRLVVHVVNGDGKPTAGAPVQMTGADGKIYTGTANADGTVVFEHMCPGKYSLSSGSNTTNGQPTSSVGVEMGCNDKKEVKLVVKSSTPPPPPPPPPPTDTCCHGRLAVHVYDGSGKPLPGAPVQMIGNDGKIYKAVTNADGVAIFENLCDGRYKVTMNTANGATAGTVVEMGCSDRQETKIVSPVQPPPPPPPPMDSCCNGKLVAHVSNGNGLPKQGVTVTMTGSNGKTYTGVTDANGTVVFEHLCDGHYVLHGTAENSAGSSTTEGDATLGCNDKKEVNLSMFTR